MKKIFKFFHSMRIHAFFAILLCGAISLALVSVTIHLSYLENSIQLKTSSAKDHAIRLSQKIVDNAYLMNSANLPDIEKEIIMAADSYDGRVVVVDNYLKIVCDTYGMEKGKTLISKEVIKSASGAENIYRDDSEKTVELTLPIRTKATKTEPEKIVGTIIFTVSTNETFTILGIIDRRMALVMILGGIALIIFAYLYARSLVKPVNKIIESIKHAGDGYLDEMVSIRGNNEVEKISEAFNDLLMRIKAIEDSRQEFVSNVSHELKTPMTSMKVLADSLLMQEDVPVELYREFMQDINAEIERENKIITDLLSLVKLNRTTGEMHVAEVSINELIEIILKRMKPIAQLRNIDLVFESFRPVIAEVDEVKLSLALSNLVENAIKYNKDSGFVHVSLNSDHKFFYVKISDSGIGIPEEEQGYIFDRFYRVDKTRSRETGGTGLGLAITKSVVIMHKGAVKVYSEEGEGATFTIRIPLSFIV